MSARPATSANRKWHARREVIVENQSTERTATAMASDYMFGETEGESHVRDVTVTIHSSHGDNAGSGIFVEVEAGGTGSGFPTRHFTIGDHSTAGCQLGDLPLLVLALQEAIRIGVEQGAFPEIRGDHPIPEVKLA